MPSWFEQILVFCVVSILVGLFSWIYLRNRERKSGMWLLGWIAILIHFAAPILAALIPGWSPLLTIWINRATLIIAGTFFLFSVSSYSTDGYRAAWSLIAIFSAALTYLTTLALGFRQSWFYLILLGGSILLAIGKAFLKNGLRSGFAWFLLASVAPYATWAEVRIAHGKLAPGLDVFLYTAFVTAGALYYRHFRRLTPGVLWTSISFMAWGAVFPLSTFLAAQNIFLSPVIWDLPKYFVAFGMIITLFENEADVALAVAGKYQALFEDNLAAVYVSSLDGKLLDCNSAFIHMYGFSSKEEALLSSGMLLCSDSRERESFISKLHQEGQVVNHECRHRRRDGTPFWILERATIVTTGAGKGVIEGTAIEISERKQAELSLKQSEERFSTIFRQSPMGCAIVSLGGTFLDANDNLLKMLGREASEVVGKTATDLGLWKNQQQRDSFYENLRRSGAIRNMRVEFADQAGNRREGNYFATLVRVGGKECIFGMLLDQTEQRELEAKFLQSQKMEVVGRLAGGVAHDFNNLLGVIGGYAELLETKLQNDKLKDYCTKILDTTQRAGGLTRQLLTFSRKEFTRPTPLRPDQAIHDLAGILPRMIGEDIELVLDLRSNGVVVMDRTHFEQIVINVVVNSRDAMPNGGQLYISTADILRPALDDYGNATLQSFVMLSLRDTGCGMSEEICSHAFEPFYTTKEIGRGTGLGLATVYGIVQQCRGEIKLDSKPGKGTSVNIFLPISDDDTVFDFNIDHQEVMAGSGNILLVEDEAELRDSNAEFLESIGYSVRCAGSGPEALAMVGKHDTIDLVISDVVMPKMNGREFANQLLQDRPATKLLFVSGYTDDILLQAGFSAEETPFLQKPYSLRELGIKVHEILHTQNGFAASAD